MEIGLDNYKLLWIAVLERAVLDMHSLLNMKRTKPHISDDYIFKTDIRILETWFSSKSEVPGSYRWICSLVDIDPDGAIRILHERWSTPFRKKIGIRLMTPGVKASTRICGERS